jgi:hypothetical protein
MHQLRGMNRRHRAVAFAETHTARKVLMTFILAFATFTLLVQLVSRFTL